MTYSLKCRQQGSSELTYLTSTLGLGYCAKNSFNRKCIEYYRVAALLGPSLVMALVGSCI